MAREFGLLSYKPENVGFIMNGSSGKDGEPWSIITHSIYKNIMLAAYRTPSTAEELSVELGVALPYMDDELEFLVNSTLMKKNGSKYETNIFIVSAETQNRVHQNLAKLIPKLTEAVINAVEYRVKCLNENGVKWHGGYQAYDDMKWSLLMNFADEIRSETVIKKGKSYSKSNVNLGPWGHTLRPNGGEWDLLGLEVKPSEIGSADFVGLHGCNDYSENKKVNFRQFKFNYKRICDKTPVFLEYREGLALLSAVNGKAGEVSSELLDKLAEYGYLHKTDSGYIPKLAVFYGDDPYKGLDEKQKGECRRLSDIAVGIAKEHYNYCRELIYGEIPEFMKNDRYQIDHACGNIFLLRGAILEEALKQGYIFYGNGENEAKERALGALIFV